MTSLLLLTVIILTLIAAGVHLRVKLDKAEAKLASAESRCEHLENSMKGMFRGRRVPGYEVQVCGMQSPLYELPRYNAQFDVVDRALTAKNYTITKDGEIVEAGSLKCDVAMCCGDQLNLSLDTPCLMALKS